MRGQSCMGVCWQVNTVIAIWEHVYGCNRYDDANNTQVTQQTPVLKGTLQLENGAGVVHRDRALSHGRALHLVPIALGETRRVG